MLELDTGGQQKKQRVEIELLRHHPVLAQILRNHRRGHAMRLVGAGRTVEARGQQRELGRIGHREALFERREAVPGLARRERPKPGVAGEEIGRHMLPRNFVGRALERRVADRDPLRDEGIEEPAPRRVPLLLLEFAPDRAQLLAQFDPEPNRVVPQDLARSALHHLRADVERGEQRIERRGRGELHEAFVEAAMLDAAPLALDVPVAHMNLRGLREAGQLLVRRLGGDDAGRSFAKVAQAHREPSLVERVKLHETRPGLIEHDVFAKAADALDNALARRRSCRHRCTARSPRPGTAARASTHPDP